MGYKLHTSIGVSFSTDKSDSVSFVDSLAWFFIYFGFVLSPYIEMLHLNIGNLYRSVYLTPEEYWPPIIEVNKRCTFQKNLILGFKFSKYKLQSYMYAISTVKNIFGYVLGTK